MELGPQMPEHSRAFINHGLFGINKHRPLTFISALHYPNYSGHRGSYSGHRGSSDIHSHSQYDYGSHDHDGSDNYGSGQGHGYDNDDDDDFRSFGSHKHRYDHGSHKYGYDHGSHKHRYVHGSSNAYGHGIGYRGSHKHGNSHVISHGSGFGSSQGNGHSSSNIYELSHGVPADVYEAIYKKYGSHSHGPHAINNHMSHKGLHNLHSKFRSNDEMEETMMPNSYDFDQTEFEDMNQVKCMKQLYNGVLIPRFFRHRFTNKNMKVYHRHIDYH